MALFRIVQMILVHCISRSHNLKIDFQDENIKKIFSETARPGALTAPSGPLQSLFKLSPSAQKWPCPGSRMFNISL